MLQLAFPGDSYLGPKGGEKTKQDLLFSSMFLDI